MKDVVSQLCGVLHHVRIGVSQCRELSTAFLRDTELSRKLQELPVELAIRREQEFSSDHEPTTDRPDQVWI